ncbi:MAG: PH domain-containing protein [Thermoanaerobaculales bacterium]
MGYLDRNLMEGETVVYRTKLHWIALLPAALLAIVLLAGAVAVLVFEPKVWPAAVGLALVAAIVLAGPLTRVAASDFAVTNKRVAIKVGFIHRRTLEMMLAKVESIAVDQGMAARLFNYGTLTVRGTGGTPETFERMRAPLDFRRHVNEQLAARE